jgi:SNF2 family DNA or RNA helicase
MPKDSGLNILHGTCRFDSNDLSFIIWVESNNKTAKKDFYPYCGNPTFLRPYIEEIIPDSILSNKIIEVSIPSYETNPLISNELSGIIELDNNDDNEILTMKKWKINAIHISIPGAVKLMLNINSINKDKKLVFGSDIKFWSSVSLLIIDLLKRGKLIPGIIEENGFIRSRWIPLFETSEEQEIIYTLAQNMPESCLMMNYGYTDKESILRAFVNNSVDMLSREFCSGVYSNIITKNTGDIYKWVHSLSTRDSLVSYSRSLAIMKIREWTERVYKRTESPLKIGFKISPQEDEESDWKLEIMIQSKLNPDFIAPLGDVMDPKSEGASFIKKFTAFPEEFVLESFGIASMIFPPLKKGYKESFPSVIYLTTDEAYDMLKEYGNLLMDAGFSFIVPDWWRKNRNPAIKINIKNETGKGILNSEAILRYNLDIVIDGETIPEEYLLKLANMEIPLVKISGKWVELSSRQIKSALKMLEKGKNGVTLPELLSMDIDKDSLPIEEITGNKKVMDLINLNIKNIKAPASLNAKLRDYQNTGLSWLSGITETGFGCCLADDMGLGKTVEVISYILSRKEKNNFKGTSIIICPTSLIANWEHEIKKFAPSLNVLIHHGSKRKKDDDFISNIANFDIVLTSYSIATRDSSILRSLNWDGVIIDEAQYIKNRLTKQSNAIKSFKSNYRIAMTGTPVENRLDELWSIFDFINPGYLGPQKTFRENFEIPVERETDRHALAVLSRLTRPFILRRLKNDKKVAPDLPEKNEMKLYVSVTKEQAVLYDKLVNEMMESIKSADNIKRRGIVLATITKLKRVLDYPSLVTGDKNINMDRSFKLKRLIDMLYEIGENNEKALIFTQYKDTGKILKELIEREMNEETMFLSGESSTKLRDTMINRFQDISGPGIFIVSLRAGGFGLNLTAATNVIHFDRWWNPAVENQATDRAYRIGQTKNVNVYKFVTSGTIEEKIDELIESKSMIMDQVVTSGESWITNLSNDKLKEILRLRKNSIETVEVE